MSPHPLTEVAHGAPHATHRAVTCGGDEYDYPSQAGACACADRLVATGEFSVEVDDLATDACVYVALPRLA